MSKDIQDIGRALSDFSSKYGPASILPAEVLQVNGDDTISVRLSDGVEIEDVRLRSVVKVGNKVLLIPKVGSIVQIARIENSEEFLVIAVEEITSVLFIIGTARFEVDQAGFLIKKGAESLGKLVADLLDAILSERHNTMYGPTVSLTPDSQLKFNQLKTRAANLLKNA